MSKIIIIVNADVDREGQIPAAPVTKRMVNALEKAIATYELELWELETISAASLWSNGRDRHPTKANKTIYCPLTISLPHYFKFSHQNVFQACQDIKARRHWVREKLACGVCKDESQLGDLWLPIILSSKGITYAPVIGEGIMPNSYEQPILITDSHLKTLQDLASQLLTSLNAPPAVYLLQFCLRDNLPLFDRLWPFPATPAIASIGVQQPDLFTCHWLCLTHQSLPSLSLLDA